jgi:hypothetical protein
MAGDLAGKLHLSPVLRTGRAVLRPLHLQKKECISLHLILLKPLITPAMGSELKMKCIL